MTRFTVFDPVTLKRDLDADETGFEPAGAVTVSVDGAAAVAATKGTGTVYTVPLGVLPMGVHSVVWFDGAAQIAADTVEVVGGHICSLADVRAGDSEFADKARFSAPKLAAARAYVEDEFEQITGRSFVRRVAEIVEWADGSGLWVTGLSDSPKLLSVTVDGVAADVTTYSVDGNGVVEGPALEVAGSVVVARVEYGLTAVPEDVKRVAGIRVRSVVSQRDSGVPDRATSIVSPDGGQVNLATPGRAGYETGIPEVDAVLARYTFKVARDVLGWL